MPGSFFNTLVKLTNTLKTMYNVNVKQEVLKMAKNSNTCKWVKKIIINSQMHASELHSVYISACGNEYDTEIIEQVQKGKITNCPGCKKIIQGVVIPGGHTNGR